MLKTEVMVLKESVAEQQSKLESAAKREQQAARRSEQLAVPPVLKPSPEQRKSIFDTLFKVPLQPPHTAHSIFPPARIIDLNMISLIQRTNMRYALSDR